MRDSVIKATVFFNHINYRFVSPRNVLLHANEQLP